MNGVNGHGGGGNGGGGGASLNDIEEELGLINLDEANLPLPTVNGNSGAGFANPAAAAEEEEDPFADWDGVWAQPDPEPNGYHAPDDGAFEFDGARDYD